MKKTTILLLSLMLVCVSVLSFVTAQSEIDGFEFNIATIDGSIAGEDGVIVTTQAGLADANLNWAISILCEKVSDNVYRAKQDAIQGSGGTPDVTMSSGDIVIGIHSSTSDVSLATEYPNVYSKIAAMQVKAGMYFTLVNIDLAAKTSDNGKAVLSLTEPGGGEDVSYDDIMGEPVQNPGYVLDVTVEETYRPGDTLNLTVTMRDIMPETGIGLINIKLYYDPTKVDPVILNDGSLNTAMDAFLTVAPNINNWEGLSKLEPEQNRYDISFSTTDAASHAKDDGSLVITVPFTVKSNATGQIIFQVPHNQTSALDYDLNNIYGNAGIAISNPAAASESSVISSEASVSIPQTGDNGDKGTIILVFVALSTLAGVVVVTKRRRYNQQK